MIAYAYDATAGHHVGFCGSCFAERKEKMYAKIKQSLSPQT